MSQRLKRRISSKARGLHKLELYAMTRKAADIIFEYATTRADDMNSEKPWIEDRRKDNPNPFLNQTAYGLYLELYYGTPYSLWTPWGEWNFAGPGSDSWENILPSIIRRFAARLHHPLILNETGEYGPVYELRKVENKMLPRPLELDKSIYASYEEAKNAWEEMTRQYYNSA